jgi:hypothetical protein
MNVRAHVGGSLLVTGENPHDQSIIRRSRAGLTGADCYGLENLANLDRVSRRGATVVVGLMPYERGSGGMAASSLQGTRSRTTPNRHCPASQTARSGLLTRSEATA